jgi:hypothetical protein
MGLYGIVHEIRVEGNEILYRTMFGRCKKYSFSEITKAVSNHEDKVRIYNGNKRLFTLTSGMDSTFFQVKLMKLGVPIEDIKGMTTDFHTVQPYGIFKWGAAVTLAFFSVIMVNLVEEDGVIVIACALFNAFLLFSVFKFFIEKTEVQGDTITQRAFLKKKQVIKISQISCLREEFKGSVPFVAIYSGKEKIMRIRRFSDGIVLFEAKMRKEEIRWHRN